MASQGFKKMQAKKGAQWGSKEVEEKARKEFINRASKSKGKVKRIKTRHRSVNQADKAWAMLNDTGAAGVGSKMESRGD